MSVEDRIARVADGQYPEAEITVGTEGIKNDRGGESYSAVKSRF